MRVQTMAWTGRWALGYNSLRLAKFADNLRNLCTQCMPSLQTTSDNYVLNVCKFCRQPQKTMYSMYTKFADNLRKLCTQCSKILHTTSENYVLNVGNVDLEPQTTMFLKGQCHKIFWIFLFPESNPPRPLIDRLKWFWIFLSFCGDIRKINF